MTLVPMEKCKHGSLLYNAYGCPMCKEEPPIDYSAGDHASEQELISVLVDPGQKPTNPKDAFGIKKASMSCVSAPVMMEVAVGMMEGACKYGRHNYRSIGVRGSVYYDAAMRHLMDWWEGIDIDPDSGLSHVSKAIASLVVLRDAMIQGKFNDDRPPKSKPWLSDLNNRAADLAIKYPDPVKPYTETDNSWIKQKES